MWEGRGRQPEGMSYQLVGGTYLASSGWPQVGSRDQMKPLFIKSWAFGLNAAGSLFDSDCHGGQQAGSWAAYCG